MQNGDLTYYLDAAGVDAEDLRGRLSMAESQVTALSAAKADLQGPFDGVTLRFALHRDTECTALDADAPPTRCRRPARARRWTTRAGELREVIRGLEERIAGRTCWPRSGSPPVRGLLSDHGHWVGRRKITVAGHGQVPPARLLAGSC